MFEARTDMEPFRQNFLKLYDSVGCFAIEIKALDVDFPIIVFKLSSKCNTTEIKSEAEQRIVWFLNIKCNQKVIVLVDFSHTNIYGTDENHLPTELQQLDPFFSE